MKERLVIGTRASTLALWQAHWVRDSLARKFPQCEVEIRHIATTGDKIQDVPLAKIGGKALFTKEIEMAILAGEIDLAVHSMKDMPTVLPEGLFVAAVPERMYPGDVLLSPLHKTLEGLPRGARVGTSSLRRRAQVRVTRPDLEIVELRGNVDTRIKKISTDQLDGIILAAAGLQRLGLDDQITQMLPLETFLPAAGQGALAIETRMEDTEVVAMVQTLEHGPSRLAITAERAMLGEMAGGCQVPIGVYARIAGATLHMEGLIADLNGETCIRESLSGSRYNAEGLGRELARVLLARGGREILASSSLSLKV
jgi:hydroxymethylbilane synthase